MGGFFQEEGGGAQKAQVMEGRVRLRRRTDAHPVRLTPVCLLVYPCERTK